jgi:hypothetical protein
VIDTSSSTGPLHHPELYVQVQPPAYFEVAQGAYLQNISIIALCSVTLNKYLASPSLASFVECSLMIDGYFVWPSHAIMLKIQL